METRRSVEHWTRTPTALGYNGADYYMFGAQLTN